MIRKKALFIAAAAWAVLSLPFGLFPLQERTESAIQRATFTKNIAVLYPGMNGDGSRIVYIGEDTREDTAVRSVRLWDIPSETETVLFEDGKTKAPESLEGIALAVGSKPPVISGDGRTAVVSLSSVEPELILDHYLAVFSTENGTFDVFPFSFPSMKKSVLEESELQSLEWDRVASYALSADGKTAACVVKGHIGPSRFGTSSAVVFLDLEKKTERWLMAPRLEKNAWEWTSYPASPLAGGGWAFCLSGNGRTAVFGARSSEDPLDYDLYTADTSDGKIARLTDFNDRWFSLADISYDGGRIAFYYTGGKKQGQGTYIVNRDGSGLRFLTSKSAPEVELYDMSSDGRIILFKNVYTGLLLNVDTGEETTAFDEKTPGYVSSAYPMDFPQIPSFWTPVFCSRDAERVLLTGIPEEKSKPEAYILTLKR